MKYVAIAFTIAITVALAYPLESMDITDTPRPSPAFKAGQIDVLSYFISIDISHPDSGINQLSEAIMYVRLTEDTLLLLDFETEDLDTSCLHVWLNNDTSGFEVPATFEDSLIIVNISADSLSEIGDTSRLQLNLCGLPYSSGIYKETSPDGPIIYSLFWPSLARRLFPCIDHPGDRATCTLNLTVPNEMTVAAGGELLETDIDSLTTHWTFLYEDPVCTYNISFAVGNYAAIETTALGGSLQVKSYAYPSDLTDTEYDFARIPQMIELYDSLFGDYPFSTAGCVVTPMAVWGGTGGMEHQTLPNIGQGLITGSRAYEEVVAHEMSHQWFGDCIGIADWADFWLNEGIAVYSEVLWVEHIEGEAAAETYMTGIESDYRTYASYYDDFPMYDPEDYLSYIPYNKGACWWRMLRWMLGHDDFFEFLRYYFDRFAYSTVVTDSLNLALNDFTGENWDWYFDQWIYKQGYPQYGFYFESRQDSLGWFIDVWLKQTQGVPMCTLFTMPVPMEINTPDSTWEVVFDVDARTSYDRFRVPDTVEYILFDRRNAICGTFTYDPTANVTERFAPEKIALNISPNPFNSALRIESDANSKLEIFDILGNEIDEIPRQGDYRPKGPTVRIWEPSSEVSGGIYFIKLTTDNQTEVRKAIYLK